ncbi:MAG: hypothetical protein GDA56_24475 [Hormoscilla sp. GM7CHS1pb]|nr:hypothetical protein [Hormoscilla sp. GM7CHS1pb]
MRRLLRKQWIDENTGKVSLNAYYLRKKKNEMGLSVRIASVCTPSECADRFRNCYGVVSLQVGSIRELGLDVVLDSQSHGQIVGLPYREDDRTTADRLADSLASLSQIVWRP